MTLAKIPYVLKPNYLQVVIEGKPFSLDNTHPTFVKLKKALKEKDWDSVPKLVSLAEQVMAESGGDIKIKNGAVMFRGREVKSSLSERIVKLVKEKQSVNHLTGFMQNLYLNPSQEAIDEFYDWLIDNNLPITDDGEFLAYKSVNHNYRDNHTDKIDNHPGKIVLMRRKAGDPNWRTQCSSGFHVCSKHYGTYGTKQMAVKINPRDVLSAVQGKMRVLRYEVLFELGSKNEDLFKTEGYVNFERKAVVQIAKTRQELLKRILALPGVKRNIKKKKMSERKIKKMSFARLKSLLTKLKPQKQIKSADIKTGNDLEGLRKSSGLTRGQLAKKLNLTARQLLVLEAKTYVEESDREKYLDAILTLQGRPLNTSLSFNKVA